MGAASGACICDTLKFTLDKEKCSCIQLFLVWFLSSWQMTGGGYSLSEANYLLGQKIFQKIRQDIIAGKYSRDEELKELLIASEMGVSRTPVREALRQLEREGLVAIIPNKGTYVVGITVQDMKDIYDIRAVLERLCVRQVANIATVGQIEALEEILYLAEYHLKKGHRKQVVELSGKFHEILYEASGNRMLGRVLQNYYLYLEQVRMFLFTIPGKFGEVIGEHRQILEAIKEQDGEKAEQAVGKHIGNVMKLIDSYGWENITGGQKDG